MKRRKIRYTFNRIFLDKIIFYYFLFFKRVFKKDIFEYSIGMHFQNFVLRFIKGVNTKIIGNHKANYLILFNKISFILRDPTIYYNLIRYGEYEPTLSYIFSTLIKKGMTILDIGGNIGYFSLMASRLVGPNGKVYVFEPDPTNFMYLRKNIEINDISNINLVKKCVSNKEGIIKLHHHPIYHSCHSIFKSSSKRSTKEIDVESIVLDKMFKNECSKISFIKMDIEGAELNALKGMANLLKKNKVKYLLTEYNSRILRSIGKNANDFIAELANYFSRYYVILDDINLKFDLFTKKDTLIRYLNSLTQNRLDILCVK